MSLILAGFLVLLGILVIVKIRQTPERPASTRKPASSSRSPGPGAPPKRVKPPSEAIDKFRGAALFPQKDACEAIMKLRGKTFPEGRIPHVPVPGCDRGSCECQVHDVVGRRRGPRRIAIERRGDVRFKEDRRNGKDRREGVDTWKNSKD